MAATLTKILLHITFSTKHRRELITPRVEPDLYAYVGGICRNLDSKLITINGPADHVHLLVNLSKRVSLADLLMNIKRDSSRWMHDVGRVSDFAWQTGYFGFSIGESMVDAVKAYIANQKEHHKTVDFRDEMRGLMRKYGMEWDERYVWD
ncbi:MAG: IS200/IS605 family transposase [Planctomycetota bacterium]|nr:IS200/IS605 family transposase [Planctomycetota bacterium]